MCLKIDDRKIEILFFQIIHNSFVKEKSINKYCFCFCLRVLYGEILLCLSVYNINISNTCIIMKKKTQKLSLRSFSIALFPENFVFVWNGKDYFKKECLHCSLGIFCIAFYLFFFFKICFLFIYQFHFLLSIFFSFWGEGEGRRKVWDSVYKWVFFLPLFDC